MTHRTRMYLATVVGVAALALGTLTVLWPEWIEALTGVDPDAGSGALEWGIVLAAAAFAVVSLWFADHERRAAFAAAN